MGPIGAREGIQKPPKPPKIRLNNQLPRGAGVRGAPGASPGGRGCPNFEVSVPNSQTLGSMTPKPMLRIHPMGCMYDISLVVMGPTG